MSTTGEKFTDLLSRVRRDDLADMANTDVAFETIVANVLNAPMTSHNPLFQVMFAFQNIDFPSLELGGRDRFSGGRGNHSGKGGSAAQPLPE